ncbi:flavin reductase family protein [Salirhabdus salicampi]|uniref:flavin reductase family protein n=1 Tax=Salirhabdus salicampi TaxID=476102 RepID=UPI0020C2F7EB|nr:flavin reductase family protein [Salirhabdus salicampi]MCP8616182.1 flavin reductase family protein [Salirhabdus salicampi]
MLSIDPKKLSAKDNYKLLSGSVIPRPIAFVTTLSEEGTLNGAPFSFFNVVNSDPPMVSVSVQRRDGEQKDTARNAIDQNEFVVHIVDESYVHAMNETAASLPAHVSEITEANLTPVESREVKVPGIQEASIRFECKLDRIIPFGDNGVKCDFLLGKVVHYHIRDDLYYDGKIDPKGLKPIGRLAGLDYSKLGEMFSIERPK